MDINIIIMIIIVSIFICWLGIIIYNYDRDFDIFNKTQEYNIE
jgi:hypothetical protein